MQTVQGVATDTHAAAPPRAKLCAKYPIATCRACPRPSALAPRAGLRASEGRMSGQCVRVLRVYGAADANRAVRVRSACARDSSLRAPAHPDAEKMSSPRGRACDLTLKQKNGIKGDVYTGVVSVNTSMSGHIQA
eukprot:4900213-Prymnesium_polylepis.1